MKSQEDLKKELKKARGLMMKCILGFVASLLLTVVFYNLVAGQSFTSNNVKRVQATVVDNPNGSFITDTKNDRYVEYGGMVYKVNNIKTGEAFRFLDGAGVEVYLYDGEMYANMDGVKTSTPISNIYFIFLGLTIVMLFIMIFAVSSFAQARKNYKNFNPDAYERYSMEKEGIYSVPEDRFR